MVPPEAQLGLMMSCTGTKLKSQQKPISYLAPILSLFLLVFSSLFVALISVS